MCNVGKSFEIRVRRVISRSEIPQRDLAAALGVHVSTISRTLAAGEPGHLPVSSLPDLYDVLGEGLVEALDPILAECGAGYRMAPLPHDDARPLDLGLLEVGAGLGHLHQAVLDARDPQSPGGSSLTRLERSRIRDLAAAVERRLAAIRAGLGPDDEL